MPKRTPEWIAERAKGHAEKMADAWVVSGVIVSAISPDAPAFHIDRDGMTKLLAQAFLDGFVDSARIIKQDSVKGRSDAESLRRR